MRIFSQKLTFGRRSGYLAALIIHTKVKSPNHLHHLKKCLDVYLKSCDNILIMRDFNSEVSENCLNGFCNVNSLKTLNRGPTCFKNPSNPSCIGMLLTNRKQCFQQTHAIETGIPDFHKMVVTVMKTHYKK